jgi:tetratricopeptide (TPR) repeat protein
MALATFTAVCAAAAEQWIRVSTPHFELLTAAGEKKGREAILYFEQVRSFFLQASPSKRVPDFPVRIIAFRGEKQYKPYRLNDFAIAYYTGSHDRDYIVMQDIQADHFPVAIHEYTHLIVRHTGLNIPIWMNEGLAELFSTLKPRGDKALVGDLIPGRIQALQTSKWIPLAVLSTVDEKSPLYNERDKASMFYSESWAAVHMLFLSKKYSPHFGEFVAAISAGKTLPEASQQSLGVTVAELEKDLQAYFKGNQLFGALFPVKLEKSAEEATVTEVPSFESDMTLGDLLAVLRKPAEARQVFERQAKENPARPEVQESLAYLAWQEQDTKRARDHFARAFASGSRNPQALYHYAALAEEAGDSDQVIAALKRAVDVKPDYTDARLHLGSRLLAKEDYAGALDAFKGVKRVNEQQAEWFFGAIAFAQIQAGEGEKARINAQLAKKWAKTPAEIQQADELIKYLDGNRGSAAQAKPEPLEAVGEGTGQQTSRPKLARKAEHSEVVAQSPNALSQAEGTAKMLECKGKSARFTILTVEGPVTFDIPDPAAVALNNSGNAVRDFTCGPQNGYHVTVGYEKSDPTSGTVGVVKTLEF